MGDKVLYLCDPEKNVQCKKTYCIYNPDAKWRCCNMTSEKEYARLDLKGQPCIAPEDVTESLKKSNQIGYKIKYAFYSILKAIFHHNNARQG